MKTLDTDVLGELRGLGEEDLRDLIGLYFADVEVQLDHVREALGDGDAQVIAAAAHRIKGASLSIGAARVGSIAAELEEAGKVEDLGRCQEFAQALQAEIDPTRSALSAELDAEWPG